VSGRILVAEDEERIVSFLERGLRANGYTVTSVGTGPLAVWLARDEDFDLLVLDLGLPELDGQQVLRAIRAAGQKIPVIVLTAREGVDDTVSSFEGGADDYMTKPFRFEELLVRVRARLRTTDDDGGDDGNVLQVGALSLDLRTRRARIGDRGVELTTREFTLTEVFMRHPGQVLSREQLLSRVWGYDFAPESNVVDVYVRYLRKKFGADVIETVRGAGYRLNPDAGPAS
jgi:DNA-binding response OmpR family regulator